MKRNLVLTITSLLSILFMTFHLTDDILYGMAQAGLKNLIAAAIFVIWLYRTLVLAERRLGYVIMLAAGVPVIHMRGSGGVLGGLDAPRARRDPRSSPSSSRRGLWSLRSGQFR